MHCKQTKTCLQIKIETNLKYLKKKKKQKAITNVFQRKVKKMLIMIQFNWRFT